MLQPEPAEPIGHDRDHQLSGDKQGDDGARTERADRDQRDRYNGRARNAAEQLLGPD